MCSRYELSCDPARVMVRFGLRVPPPFPNRAEVRPTDLALVIGADGPRLMRWGLSVEWDKRPLINARAETLDTRPTFCRLLENRVLIPATSWWEWQGKTKYRLSLADGDLLAFAGLSDGEAFTMVTCAPARSIAHVHDRMPAVLEPGHEAEWLGGAPLATTGDLTARLDGPQGDLFA